ncbi:MAG TPA: LarC family nickel insertion protein, partial [Anaerolineae bacterium]|nr:LarC family nickel insertion protein [Anaerolineae bacterium]
MILYVDCFSGAGGDMLLAALLDAGLPFSDLQADLSGLGVGGYALEARRVTRHGLTGTHLDVHLTDEERPARTMPAIERIITGSDLDEAVKVRSLAVFRRIARAEAAVHGTTVDQVHFHEIGAVDSLVDIVGFAAGLARLGVDAVYSSALPLGGGTVHTEHGLLPAPAPATLALLAQVGAPTIPGPAATELVTPTAAALLAEFATFRRPPMRLRSVGYGFGTKEFDWPNAVRVWLGETTEELGPPLGSSEVVLLSCNLDDVTGEVLGYTLER